MAIQLHRKMFGHPKLLIALMITSATVAYNTITFALPGYSQTEMAATSSLQSESSFKTASLADHLKPRILQVLVGWEAEVYWAKTKKTYKVSIQASGSAFSIRAEGKALTNAHVVEFGQSAEEAKSFLLRRFVEDRLKEDAMSVSEASELNPDKDLKIGDLKSVREVRLHNGEKRSFTIVKSGSSEVASTDLAIIQVQGITNAPVLILANSEPQNLERIFNGGYPGIITDSFPKAEPTFVDGIVSAKQRMKDGSEVLQMTSIISGGDSGSPVVNQQGEVVGVSTFVSAGDPRYSFAIPLKPIIKFLQDAGITNEEGITDVIYRDAITLYKKGNFGQALSKFLEVRRLFPYDTQVQKYIENCHQNITGQRLD